jgi:hypothetical protein
MADLGNSDGVFYLCCKKFPIRLLVLEDIVEVRDAPPFYDFPKPQAFTPSTPLRSSSPLGFGRVARLAGRCRWRR